MKKLKTAVILALALVVLFAGVCLADTFTNRQTNETLHGYITARLPGSGPAIRRDENSPKSAKPKTGKQASIRRKKDCSS